MQPISNIKRPTKQEQIAAMKSYDALANILNELKDNYPEIEIEETGNPQHPYRVTDKEIEDWYYMILRNR